MKKIIYILGLILLILCSTTKDCCAQDRIVQIPQSELDAFFMALDTLEYQDSVKTEYIKNLEIQNTQFFQLRVNNLSIVAGKDEEILLLTEQITLYNDRLKISDAWYNKRW